MIPLIKAAFTLFNKSSQRINRIAPRFLSRTNLAFAGLLSTSLIPSAVLLTYKKEEPTYESLIGKYNIDSRERKLLDLMQLQGISFNLFPRGASQEHIKDLIALLKKYSHFSLSYKALFLQYSEEQIRFMVQFSEKNSGALSTKSLMEITHNPLMHPKPDPKMVELLFMGSWNLHAFNLYEKTFYYADRIEQILHCVTTEKHAMDLLAIGAICNNNATQLGLTQEDWSNLIHHPTFCVNYLAAVDEKSISRASTLLHKFGLPHNTLTPVIATQIANSLYIKKLEESDYYAKELAREIFKDLPLLPELLRVLNHLQTYAPSKKVDVYVQSIVLLKKHIQEAKSIVFFIESLNAHAKSDETLSLEQIISYTSKAAISDKYIHLVTDCSDGRVKTNQAILRLLYQNEDSVEKIQELIKDHCSTYKTKLTPTNASLIAKQLEEHLNLKKNHQNPTPSHNASKTASNKSSIGILFFENGHCDVQEQPSGHKLGRS